MQIDNLKKVSLNIRAGDVRDMYNHVSEPVELEFIYGVASEGLCGLEVVLNSKVTGVREAESREVVQAMSKSLGHGGCRGSCDCGCGLKNLRLFPSKIDRTDTAGDYENRANNGRQLRNLIPNKPTD